MNDTLVVPNGMGTIQEYVALSDGLDAAVWFLDHRTEGVNAQDSVFQ